MEKITFGDSIPGYIYGPEDTPGVVMLQASCHNTRMCIANKDSEQRYCNPADSHCGCV